jgi:hypothetical protein
MRDGLCGTAEVPLPLAALRLIDLLTSSGTIFYIGWWSTEHGAGQTETTVRWLARVKNILHPESQIARLHEHVR